MHQGIAALFGLRSWIVYRVEQGEDGGDSPLGATDGACGAGAAAGAWGQALLDRLLFCLEHADDAELVRWGRTLRAWKAELLAGSRHRIPSGYTEGIHTKIKLLKRLRYGFRNRPVYVRKMLLGLVPLALLRLLPHLLT